jgi:outer membrane biosynthesis protein TonB
MEAIQRWRSEPPRINGAPIPRAVLVQVKFKP